MIEEKEEREEVSMLDEMGDPKELEMKLMEGARELDKEEGEAAVVSGDFSKMALNKVVDALNRVNLIFKAPPYPSFEAEVETLPPEFIRNLDMVNAAARDAGRNELVFSFDELKSDRDLKMLAGKLDAAAGDKVLAAYLAKPQGMGDLQSQFGIPAMEMSGGDTNVMTTKKPVMPEEEEEELFMARVRA